MDQIVKPDPATVSLLTDLIGFDTTSRHSNLELIDYVEALLQQHDVQVERSWNRERSKANLFATIGSHLGDMKNRRSGVIGPYRRCAGGWSGLVVGSVQGGDSW